MRLALFPTLFSLWKSSSIYINQSVKIFVPRFWTLTEFACLDPPAQPDLPSIDTANALASAVNLNLHNVQGDILYVLNVYYESCVVQVFASSKNAAQFKSHLKSVIAPLVTSTADLLEVSSQPTTALNIAFSQTGLHALGISDSLNFGYLDGISNPAVQGFQSPLPGQAVVPTGQILLGENGDTAIRPAWAKDGSFLVFRQLKQLVPEFNKFLEQNPIRAPGLTLQEGSDLLGARMFGRWKSGAPVFLAPLFDNPALGANPQQNNDFTYALSGQTPGNLTDQSKCPFAAHLRKMRPRADLGLPESNTHHIVRGGIPYGPELNSQEIASQTTQLERGLAFVSYQSNITNGFQFLQKRWADNTQFVHAGVGFDPIIGAAEGASRVITGLDSTNVSRAITLTTGKFTLVTLVFSN
ncbi:DyP-type peroxidase [Mycena sanguinolenta]|uniref:DyP-type peroxidase n=1 Tax=Mycena sanguinolenta TaxID=230812 RepID=A0A8H7CG48_9AGAR|nr:DyP-type peroxidase [Mycena sanguinolenta]